MQQDLDSGEDTPRLTPFHTSITVTAREFRACAEALLSDVRRELKTAQQNHRKLFLGTNPNAQNEQIQENFLHHQALARFNADMDYALTTRLQTLTPDTLLTFSISKNSAQDFQQLLSGESYSLKNLTYVHDWFAIVRNATDKHIPNAKISKAAYAFDSTRITSVLDAQPNDTAKEEKITSLLAASAFGRQLMQSAQDAGYSLSFSDLKPFNNMRQDMGRHRAAALCVTNADGKSKNIYVNTTTGHSDVHCAVKLAHECAHAVQKHQHYKMDRYTSNASRSGALNNISQFSAMGEAHSIAAEYIVASELMTAGHFNYEDAFYALYDFHADIVNKLATDPAGFIEAVSHSEQVQNRWGFRANKRKFSPKIAREFASSLPPLQAQWIDPQAIFKTHTEDMKRRIDTLQADLTAILHPTPALG